ncbi:MAG: rod shape-determining protein MreC [Thermoanaerobaculia bacterium]|nr:rod shape-determining protein MreC [Thermoanaerobaculia bacterium]
MHRRAGWLLLILLLGQLVLLTRQTPRRGPNAPPMARAVLRVVAPLAEAVAGVEEAARATARAWRTRESLQEENARLRQRLEALEGELLRLEGVEVERDRLAEALEYGRARDRRLQVADVVFADYRSWLRNFVIRVGPRGVQANQPVVAPRGLVGRVVTVAEPYARVQLITDRSSAVGAMIARTRRQGILRGQGNDPLTLEYVPLSADVRRGDEVVTAGIDRVYPQGIATGVVISVEPGPRLFHRIEVLPRVDFGVVDTVYLLPKEPLPTDLGEPELP